LLRLLTIESGTHVKPLGEQATPIAIAAIHADVVPMEDAMAATREVPAPVNTASQRLSLFPGARQQGEVYVRLPDEHRDGWVHAHARQTILVEPQALYALWKRREAFPLWQEHVVSVTPRGDGKSHWVMGDPEDPTGKRMEFDSQITEDVPGEKIAWKSIAGDIEQAGEVQFHARRDGRGTVVTVMQHFKIGAFANAAASTAQRGPRQTVIEDLRHFKELAETGEIPSVKGQAHGPRRISGGIKEWMYGETNPTPRGTQEQASATNAEVAST
jgi:uncharacterized membrane protein